MRLPYASPDPEAEAAHRGRSRWCTAPSGVWFAWTLWGLALVCAFVSFVLRTWNTPALMPNVTGASAFREYLYWIVLFPAAVPAYATVGVVVAARRPRHSIG